MNTPNRTGFRLKLMVAMMVVVSAITAVGLYVEQRNLAAEAARQWRHEFQNELLSLRGTRQMRHVALAERCRALARKPRIHAALEDNALDLLYPSARDELRDIMDLADPTVDMAAYGLHAEFYRFLDIKGRVIPPPVPKDVGNLLPEEEPRLGLKMASREQQLGYLSRTNGKPGATVSEIIAVPIISIDTDEVIATLVLGFKPNQMGSTCVVPGIKSGIWADSRLHLASLSDSAQRQLAVRLAKEVAASDGDEDSFPVEMDGAQQLLFFKRLNPGSLYPPGYEVCIFPLTELTTRQRQACWEILGAGGVMLLLGFIVSHYFSGRLSMPVEKLAVDSEENRAQRQRVEAVLEQTHEELQRSARFSADASHQLKTPVAGLRAGLDDLLSRDDLAPEVRDEISGLIHQTYRLTSVVEDLLLLSRMDAGRLHLDFAPVDLSQLVEAELDDISAQPDGRGLVVETNFPPAIHVEGEKRYTVLIVRNLVENAWKYNRSGGRIRLTAHENDGRVYLTVGNTGRGIPREAQAHIFERFHRGGMGENIPGHGLGLNLARELARLHGGDLRLMRSDDTWTEFEVSFRLAMYVETPATG